MTRIIRLAAVWVLAVAATAGGEQAAPAETVPKLVNEKLILPDAPGRHVGEMFSMRLSPDGKQVLYVRRQAGVAGAPPGPGGRTRRKSNYAIVLRDLETGRDRPLPVPAHTWDDIAVMTVSINPFGAGGRIVLGAGIDSDKNGLHDHATEKMQAVVYDPASGKTIAVAVKDDLVVAAFDRTGKGLIIAAGDRRWRKGALYTTAADKPAPQALGLWGLPRSPCPAADVLPLLLPERAASGRAAGTKLVLYDLKGEKVLAELPTHERNTKLDDLNPQWTADGRYLYYVDLADEAAEGGFTRRKAVTRIWDRTGRAEAGIMDAAVAVGPGPGKTTMVLAVGVGRSRRMILHETATGRIWPLGDRSMRPIVAQGKYVVYVRTARRRGSRGAAYMAEIIPPKRPATPPAGAEAQGQTTTE